MAQKALESVVRELQKLVSDLVIKINALECKIDEQTTIIAKQEQSLNAFTSAVVGTSKTVPPVPVVTDGVQEHVAIPATTQRPIRQARVNSSVKTAAASKKSAALKSRSDGDIGIINIIAKTPETDRVQPMIAGTTTGANPTPTTKTTSSSRECGATKSAEIRPAVAEDNHSHVNDTSDEGWQPARKARNSKRRVVTGSGKEDDDLKTVEKLKYIQAWSFKPETTEQNLLKYLNKLISCEQYIVEKRDIKTTRHAAFVIAFPESLNEQINTPVAWPAGVKLSDWFPRRPREQRGDISSGIRNSGSAHAVAGRSS